MDYTNNILWLFQLSYFQSAIALLFLIFSIIAIIFVIKKFSFKASLILAFLIGVLGIIIFSLLFQFTLNEGYYLGEYSWVYEVKSWISLPYKIFISLIFFFLPLLIFISIINVFLTKRKILFYRSFLIIIMMSSIGIALAFLMWPIFNQINITPYTPPDYLINSNDLAGNILSVFTFIIPSSISIISSKYAILSVIIISFIFGFAIRSSQNSQDSKFYENFSTFFDTFKYFINYALSKIFYLVPFVIATVLPLIFLGGQINHLVDLSLFVVLFIISMLILLIIQQAFLRFFKKKQIYNPINETNLLASFTSSNSVLNRIEEIYPFQSRESKLVLSFSATSGLCASGGFFPTIMILLTLSKTNTTINIWILFSIAIIVLLLSFLTIGMPGGDYITTFWAMTSLGVTTSYLASVLFVEPFIYPFKSFINTNGIIIGSIIADIHKYGIVKIKEK